MDELIAQLPAFSYGFFTELSRLENKATSTLIAYATDLRIFFAWARDYVPGYSDTAIKDLPLDILNALHVKDIKAYFQINVSRK